MRKILFIAILTIMGLYQTVQACDSSSFNIANIVNNPDGTTTYTLDLFTDLGGADGNFYGFVLVFNSSSNTPMPVSYPTTLAPGSTSIGTLVETLTATTGSSINSIANESGWSSYENLPNALSYETSPYSAASSDVGWTIDVTVSGCVESILYDAHTRRAPLAACQRTENTSSNCAACDISTVTAAPSVCDPSDNTYTCDVTVTYSNPPSSGSLVINGQLFAIGISPQTETLTGLTSNGNVVNATVEFSDDTSCNDTVSFTAPPSCNASCNPDNGVWN